MCNSATKGVTATAVHLLASRGLIDYDTPVATYWPEFAANGKETLTVRHLLSHAAGLHRIRPLIDSWQQVLDWNYMVDALAGAHPAYTPGTDAGYHALTFGWLAGELVRRLSGQSFADFIRDELAAPMELDGLYIGCPLEERSRIAPIRLSKKPLASSTLPKDVLDLVHSPAIMDAQIPALNGFFTARSLAAMYSMLANNGQWQGHEFIDRGTLGQASAVQGFRRDRVMILPMHWRLGYHRIFDKRRNVDSAFGHYGFGGSGGWADPDRRIGVAMICNRDAGRYERRLPRLGKSIAKID
jgi:CubicO group peptidase (beta-lactamase class C family)